ncbi:MAG TPA: efflux RND transporter permease subunit [Steroidobacteraceae bacterium]|nr:efflux RND transporter permease subunit [Steroidobacteraceae bacterium]
MARFFIDRPIFAWVIAIIIMLAGALSIHQLPVEQYPNIAPAAVIINATYPGASSRSVEESVTQVIEQSMTGLDHLVYMSSTSNAQGIANVTLTFEAGTDPDLAQVQVQNKLQQATRRLPVPVQAQGVTVTKSTAGFLSVSAFYSPNGSLSSADIGDYLQSNIIDPISRVDGVGTVQLFGSGYAMRIWLDPYKLNQYKLIPADVTAAIMAQNTQVAAGQLGSQPVLQGQQLNAPISAQSKLTTPQQFRDIVLRVNTDGSTVHLADVSRVELGAESYDVSTRTNGQPSVAMGFSLASGANALATADAVNARVAQLARFFPPGMAYKIAYDTSKFVRISINEVIKTLFEAVVLVVMVMFVFLQNLRATLIPTIAVPVVLLGTFGVLSVLGYSINTMTMFGMVLAIGLLVDDAIVVVENVERIMREEHLEAREATRKSMDQITGALLGIALVLSAVLIPMAFFGGSTGVIYRQFSITIVSAMTLSVLVALTLTPALCASILKPHGAAPAAGHGLLARFERGFLSLSTRYQALVSKLLPRTNRIMVAYLVLVGLMALLYARLPTSFLPEEDQGALLAMAKLPPGATLNRTVAAQHQLEEAFIADTGSVSNVLSVAGRSFSGNGQNTGMSFALLKDWSDRRSTDKSSVMVAKRAQAAASRIRDASIFVSAPPLIRSLGTTSGFDLELKDAGGVGRDTLAHARDQFLELAGRDPLLARVRINGLGDQPEFHLEVDQAKAGALGLSTANITDTLTTAIGGIYVNDFVDRGRVKKVYMQSDAQFRMQPGDLDNWFVRNSAGGMVPISAFASGSWRVSAQSLERFNGASSVEIVGEPAAGVSSGTALKRIEELVTKLPTGLGFEWAGLSYQEKLSGAQAPALYAISVLFVFLCLAALYESWSLPFSVMLVVPLGVIGALSATTGRGLSNDVYFQVGLLTTVGLSAKNAILIVEFAKTLRESGMELVAAVLQAVRIRLRPILMTSLSFMLGVMPLVLSHGAGAASRIAIGTGVFGGMLAATLLGVFFVPVFVVFVQRLVARTTALIEARRAPAHG